MIRVEVAFGSREVRLGNLNLKYGLSRGENDTNCRNEGGNGVSHLRSHMSIAPWRRVPRRDSSSFLRVLMDLVFSRGRYDCNERVWERVSMPIHTR